MEVNRERLRKLPVVVLPGFNHSESNMFDDVRREGRALLGEKITGWLQISVRIRSSAG